MKLSWPFAKNLLEKIRLGNIIRMNDIKIIRKLIPASPKLILDIGSNDAFWSLRITKKLKTKVIYSDLNVSALKIAKSRGLTVVCAYASALPFRSEVFNCVYSVSVYQFVTNVQDAFNEANRILKTPGNFCFCVDSFSGKGYENQNWRDHQSKREGVINFFSQEFSFKHLNNAGFKVKQQFCVLGNGWWRLLKILYWIGHFELIFWLILYPLVSLAYRTEWITGHKLFVLASKN